MREEGRARVIEILQIDIWTFVSSILPLGGNNMEKSIEMYDVKVFGLEVSDHANEMGYLDYRILAHMLEDLILNNPVREETLGDWEMVRDAVLKQNPHEGNAELVITKRGLKQYLHSSCWYEMIKEKLPYDGRMYV